MRARLIEELLVSRKKLDFNLVAQNLQSYSSIHNFLGSKWFKKIIEEKNQTHPILISLSQQRPDSQKISSEIGTISKEGNEWKRYLKALRIRDMLRPHVFLEHLEKMLHSIDLKSSKLKELREGLRNEDQFWETISEVEVISAFIDDYDIEIAPKLNSRKLDLGVEIDGEEILIEVISPRMFKPLQYLTGKAIGVKNRVRGKIYNEFKSHLSGLETKIQTPVLIVIDVGRSLINYDLVDDYLLGTLQLTLLIDKKTGKTVDERPSRAENSMHKLDKGTDVLSAIICYKSVLGNDLRYKREGRIIPNPNAKYRLSENAIEKIKKCLFR